MGAKRYDRERTAIERLTLKQRLFVEAYMGEACGNAKLAAKLAGYKGNDRVMMTIGPKNMANPLIREAMEELIQENPLVATRQERQEFLTSVMRDETQATDQRLKAVAMLGKSQGDFVERKEVVANVAVEHQHQHALDLTKLTDAELDQFERLLVRVGAADGGEGGAPLMLEAGAAGPA